MDAKRKLQQREYYLNNKDSIEKWRKKYRDSPEAKKRKKEYDALYHIKNRGKHLVKARRWYFLKEYGISLEEYNKMYVAQGGRCAICRRTKDEAHMGQNKNLHIDHDHQTGRVRGLLCLKCNVGLGAFEDNVGWLDSAKIYLGNKS